MLRRREESITKVRYCEYFLETTRVVSSFETEDLKSSNARLLCFFYQAFYLFWFIFTTLSISLITCSVGGGQNVWWWTLRELDQSRHGLIRVLSQHVSVRYWESQDFCCPVDIRTAHLSNMNAIQPYQYANLLVAKYCSYFRLPPWCSRGRRSFGVLRSVGWWIVSDVSWQHISSILNESSSPRTWTSIQIRRFL